jgi:hypothetical protein
MSAWIGPAIIAAVISAIVTAIGWYAAHASSKRLDASRRRERIKDVQTALLAEIRSHQYRLILFETQALVKEAPATSEPAKPFSPFIPREGESFVFNAIVREIHILPTAVIDPVVLYYRQISALALFAEDLRSERFERLETERKIEMYRDYLAMGAFALELAQTAIRSLDQSISSVDQ